MLFVQFVVYFFTTELYKLPKLFPYIVVLVEVIGFHSFSTDKGLTRESTHY